MSLLLPPLVLLAAVTLAIRSRIAGADSLRRLRRLGFCGEALAAVAVTALLLARFTAAASTRRESGASFAGVVVVLATLLAPVAGGVVLATVWADTRRPGDTRPWPAALSAVAVVIPLAVFVEAVLFAYSCSAR